MTLQKAIEILEKHKEMILVASNPELNNAVKLGIEALKFVEDARGITAPYLLRLLKRETEA